MSDHHDAPDPIDEAYVRAEALLDDEAARAARRARVLAAVASEPVQPAGPARRPAWRTGGWLVAACVAALGLFVVIQNYRPMPHEPQPTATAPAASTMAGPPPKAIAASPAAPATPPPAPPIVVVRPMITPTVAPSAPPPAEVAPVMAPAPPTLDIKPVEHAVAAPRASLLPPPPAAPPPPPAAVGGAVENQQSQSYASANRPQPPARDADNQVTVSDMVVAAPKRQERIESVPVAVSAYTSAQRNVVQVAPGDEKAAADSGASLRAAAAAGQVKQLEALLAQGAPVDAPDTDGDTALMKSIEADHPTAAALLVRHGASLDHRNHAGQSARDLAAAKNDAALDKALGVGP